MPQSGFFARRLTIVMRPFRIHFGALLGLALMWVAVDIYGFLAVWSPWPRMWWKYHFTLIEVSSFAIAIAPCVIVLGVLLANPFKRFPVSSAFASTTISFLIAVASTLNDPQLVVPTLRLGWDLFASFLLGPPAVVLLTQ